MTTAIAIIGAGFGDEGKGLATDYFTRAFTEQGVPPLVARGNGGAQAGHTVVDGEKRHVFGHVGSGTFAGANTYLGSNFILNAPVLKKELLALQKLGHRPDIYAHRDCRVTTIYDMAINSLAELARDNRHGSCGLGINETVTRHKAGHFLTLDMLRSSGFEVAHILQRIRKEWVPKRLHEYGLSMASFTNASADVQAKAQLYFSMFDLSTTKLAGELRRMAVFLRFENPKVFNDFRQCMIVEGAQGLMLDEFFGEFPHVTRSVTGLASSIAAANECGYTNVKPIYVTRAYTTRHGNGALLHEGKMITDRPLNDQTNVHNEWQGTLRYAPLDIDNLQRFIALDMHRAKSYAQVSSTTIAQPLIVITCLDQMGEKMRVVMQDVLHEILTAELPSIIEARMGIRVCLTSHGPSAKDVRLHKGML